MNLSQKVAAEERVPNSFYEAKKLSHIQTR